MKHDNKIFYFLGAIPVVWLALLVAPIVDTEIMGVVKNFGTVINEPFKIVFCANSIKTIIFLLIAYAFGIGIYLSTKRNTRPNEEHGSAKWGVARIINKKYMQKPVSQNKILTENVRIGLNGRKHRRNLNVLVCGGSGAGKTRFYCKPNVMQANTSFVILDPKRRNAS